MAEGLYERVLAETLRKYFGRGLSSSEAFSLVLARLDVLEEKLDLLLSRGANRPALGTTVADIATSGGSGTGGMTKPRHTLPSNMRSLAGTAGGIRGITKLAPSPSNVSPAVRP